MDQQGNDNLSAFENFYHSSLMPVFKQIHDKYGRDFIITFDEEIQGFPYMEGHLFFTRLKERVGTNSLRFSFSASQYSEEIGIILVTPHREPGVLLKRSNLFHGTIEEVKHTEIEKLIMDEVNRNFK